MINLQPHRFHIPVMGTGFTIDTPLYVARYGISSVISLVDDELIEQMREFHCHKANREYTPISVRDQDFRAKRITAYLNLLDDLIQQQMDEIQAMNFDSENDLTRYFELLPDCPLRRDYETIKNIHDTDKKTELQNYLRSKITAGSIDVNIMTKLNVPELRSNQQDDPLQNHAVAALRGFANSTVQSSVILSAGLNQQLFSYMAEFDDFFPDENGTLKKKIILKVSDYRSALVQGKILAKKGLWVSEYRIESGLNCGGHAFATKGYLLGPILEEFKENKETLGASLYPLLKKALNKSGKTVPESTPDLHVTVQGGIGTSEEQALLFEHYQVDKTGWGTPFLLVPEATNVDQDSITKLIGATQEDVYLSGSSPLGIPFWNLRTSASEDARRQRIQEEKPGASCPKGFLRFHSGITEKPICHASRTYQKHRLHEIESSIDLNGLSSVLKEKALEKSCICHDLSGGVLLKQNISDQATPAICCGPNIINFDRIYSLTEMIDHIYGRKPIPLSPDRPHMFIRELQIYRDYLLEEINKIQVGLSSNTSTYLTEFKENLLSGIEYYKSVVHLIPKTIEQSFTTTLQRLEEELQSVSWVEEPEVVMT